MPGNRRVKRFPPHRASARVAPRNPVYVRSIWGYWRHTLPLVSIANSEALRLACITRETVPPWEGIQIERDSTGEPTGVFVEQTYIPVVELSLMAVAPRFTHRDRADGLRESMKIYNATGTTSVVEGPRRRRRSAVRLRRGRRPRRAYGAGSPDREPIVG